MSGKKNVDVLGIGNAIVDVIARQDEAFLGLPRAGEGLHATGRRGRCSLSLYDKIGPGTEISGGSAANTIAGVTSLGGSAGYVGKVASGPAGGGFRPRHSRSRGGLRHTSRWMAGRQTARCIVIVSPDGQRTMSTYPGGLRHCLGPTTLSED